MTSALYEQLQGLFGVRLRVVRLRMNKYEFVSPGVVAIPGQRLGFNKGFLVRDPDGHTMRIVEK
ncbi:hypothetical protein [Fischerella sp. JS2]|uniref:hypothetical protein n=1 Tax=Fischerella sp. JS2 TaxID=2597771 RepID=UPI0028ECA711|nr:hypothetical protein [Fischerella sp. JS2]